MEQEQKQCIGISNSKCSNMVPQTLGAKQNKTCPDCKLKRNARYRATYGLRIKELDNRPCEEAEPISIKSLDRLISHAINVC